MRLKIFLFIFLLALSGVGLSKVKAPAHNKVASFCLNKNNRSGCCKMKYKDEWKFFHCLLAGLEYERAKKFSRFVNIEKMKAEIDALTVKGIYPWKEHELNKYRIYECEHELTRDVRLVLSCLIRNNFMERAIEVFTGVDETKVPKTWKRDLCDQIHHGVSDEDLTEAEAIERLERVRINYETCETIREHQ